MLDRTSLYNLAERHKHPVRFHLFRHVWTFSILFLKRNALEKFLRKTRSKDLLEDTHRRRNAADGIMLPAENNRARWDLLRGRARGQAGQGARWRHRIRYWSWTLNNESRHAEFTTSWRQTVLHVLFEITCTIVWIYVFQWKTCSLRTLSFSVFD